jgi:hypothetical protein
MYSELTKRYYLFFLVGKHQTFIYLDKFNRFGIVRFEKCILYLYYCNRTLADMNLTYYMDIEENTLSYYHIYDLMYEKNV